MLIIQCTKKLMDYVKKDVELLNSDMDKFYGWHANMFTIDRRKYIIVMNNVTRYNFVLGPIVKKDVLHLEEMISEGIKENLEADGVNKEYIDLYMNGISGVRYAKTSERSIVGQINDAIFYIEHVYWMQGMMDLSKVNRLLNQHVMLKLPMIYSQETMMKEMENRYS